MDTKNITALFACLLLVATNTANAQSRLETRLDNYSLEIKARVIKMLQTNTRYNKYLKEVESGNFVCVPSCEINANEFLNRKNDFDLIKIREDSTDFSYFMHHMNDSLFVIGDDRSSGRLTTEDIDEYDDNSHDHLFLMSRYAMRFSNHCFVLKMRNNREDVAGYAIVCYIEKNKLKVLGFKGWGDNGRGNFIIDKYDGLENYIYSKYGSVQEYLFLVSQDSAIRQIYFNTITLPRQVLRNSYYYYEKHSLTDTSSTLYFFMHEIDSLLSLTKEQNQFLINKIETNLSVCKNADSTTTVEFMGRDLKEILNMVLTKDHQQDYINKYQHLREYERVLFDKFVASYDVWDYDNDNITTKPPDVGKGYFDNTNPLHKRALDSIYGDKVF